MDPEELREHLRVLSDLAGQRQGLAASINAACWPGGAEDRVEPAALHWVRLWRPQRGAPILRACSCRLGRCALCN